MSTSTISKPTIAIISSPHWQPVIVYIIAFIITITAFILYNWIVNGNPPNLLNICLQLVSFCACGFIILLLCNFNIYVAWFIVILLLLSSSCSSVAELTKGYNEKKIDMLVN